MAKVQIGSPKAWLTFVCFYLMFGVLVVAQTVNADRVWLFLLLGYFLLGSVVIAARMWRMRGDRSKFWSSAHGSQVGILPAKWRRWVLGE